MIPSAGHVLDAAVKKRPAYLKLPHGSDLEYAAKPSAGIGGGYSLEVPVGPSPVPEFWSDRDRITTGDPTRGAAWSALIQAQVFNHSPFAFAMHYFQRPNLVPMRYLILLPLILNTAWAQAQNLVPNGSFEEYTDCPFAFGYVNNVVGWTSPNTQSADYYNVCAGSSMVGVSLNVSGYQYPAEGSGYMGVFTFILNGPDYREFIATELSASLEPGVPVYLSFKLALGGFGSTSPTSANFTCQGTGMKFFTEIPTDWPSYLYPNSAAIHLDQAITDTSAWVTVSGTYVPDSAYTQLVIGNFFDDAHSAPFIFDTAGYGTANGAYVFIDQVCVSYDSNYCSNWTGISQPDGPSLTLSSNPFAAVLHLYTSQIENAPVRIRLFDSTGRVVVNEKWIAGHIEWVLDGTTLAPGYYTLIATNTQGVSRSYALVHTNGL